MGKLSITILRYPKNRGNAHLRLAEFDELGFIQINKFDIIMCCKDFTGGQVWIPLSLRQ
jgi:hypothetical protein